MRFKIFVWMLTSGILLCFLLWLFVFRELKIPGAEVLSSTVYLLVLVSFIILGLQA